MQHIINNKNAEHMMQFLPAKRSKSQIELTNIPFTVSPLRMIVTWFLTLIKNYIKRDA